MDEYANEFERLHYLCNLGETLDFDLFCKGLRQRILKNMKNCKDMHEAYWEAICVECLIKRYRLRKAKLQEGKSLQKINSNVVEPNVENVRADIY